MHDAPVGIAPPRPVDDLRQEKAGDQEEFRHPEWRGETDNVVQYADLAGMLAEIVGGVHHHHQQDRETLGGVDPVETIAVAHCARHVLQAGEL